MKNKSILALLLTVIFVSLSLLSCNNCDTFKPTTKDFMDSVKIGIPINSFNFELYAADAYNRPVPCEIRHSSNLTDSIVIIANIHGLWLAGDSTSPNLHIEWRHDTLVVGFDYLSFATSKELSEAKSTASTAIAPCGDPGAPSFWIKSAIIELPTNKNMNFLTYGEWELK